MEGGSIMELKGAMTEASHPQPYPRQSGSQSTPGGMEGGSIMAE